MLTTRASAAGFPALKSSSRRSEDAAKYPFLSPPHRRRGARRPGRMVVSEHVQSSMHDQPQQLLAGGDSLPPRILPGNFGADINITDDGDSLPDSGEPERDDIGGTFVAKVAAIEPRDCGSPYKRDREHRIPH